MDLLQETLDELDKVIKALKKRDKEATELQKIVEESVEETECMNWIKVGDKNPEPGKEVLLYTNDIPSVIGASFGWYDGNCNVYRTGGGMQVNPTHWCSIKLPPEEEKNYIDAEGMY